ncbi:MAG: cytochrome c [Saprospiraceae bacterium]|nr:cytochrome c [Saprospiraceae bacterium]
MRKNINILGAMTLACVLMFSSGCQQAGGNWQGREYMPDMYHSIAYEAGHYTYYKNNTWGEESEYRKMAEPRLPVAGTVASNEEVYPYPNTDEGRDSAKKEILFNPVFPKHLQDADNMMAKGKDLYMKYCGVCHGKKGDGNGPLWKEGEGAYPAAPANYLSADFLKQGDTEGRYYHAIVHGKGMMQGHADKVNDEERWMIIHHIRKLQNKDYNPTIYLDLRGTKGSRYNDENLDDLKAHRDIADIVTYLRKNTSMMVEINGHGAKEAEAKAVYEAILNHNTNIGTKKLDNKESVAVTYAAHGTSQPSPLEAKDASLKDRIEVKFYKKEDKVVKATAEESTDDSETDVNN